MGASRDYCELQRRIEDAAFDDVTAYLNQRIEAHSYGSGVEHGVRYQRLYGKMRTRIDRLHQELECLPQDEYGHRIKVRR